MKLLVILAHPGPKSFNHAIAKTAVDTLDELGHDVTFHDLYAEGFDPLLPAGEMPRDGSVEETVSRHCAELSESDGIVVVHPNWWGMPPAVLAGWIDRVFRPGVAYRFLEGDAGDGVPEGLLRLRSAVVLTTSNTPAAREREVFGDPLARIWRDCVFGLCGVGAVTRRNYGVVVTSSHEERRGWLADVARLLRDAFPR